MLPLHTLLLLTQIISTIAEWTKWTKDHQQCTMNFPDEVYSQSNPSSLTQETLKNLRIKCEDLQYADYFRKILSNPNADTYYKELAKEVMGLYHHLDFELKKPMLLTDIEYSHNYLNEIPQILNDVAKSKNLSVKDVFYTSNQNVPQFLSVNNFESQDWSKLANKHVLVHPITFSIPEENIVMTIPPKMKAFGQVIPGYSQTYFHLFNESKYFHDMQKSLFAITYKKGGWDCLRHYEILAAGALPLFPDIKECPRQSISLHPKKLYELILQDKLLTLNAQRKARMTMEFHTLHYNIEKMDREFYSALLMSLLQYTKNTFSTTAMAKYVLDTVYKYSNQHLRNNYPSKVFYLTHQDRDMDKGDYMTDFVLHGLKRLLGENSVVDFPTRDGLYKTLHAFNRTKYMHARSRLYGAGFSWGLKLDALSHDLPRDYEVIKKSIIENKFDLIILGSGHRDGWASRLHFWDLVCKYYHPLEVVFIDGADYHLPKRTLNKYTPCAGHLFSREGYVP